jgi:hypothetical protein
LFIPILHGGDKKEGHLIGSFSIAIMALNFDDDWDMDHGSNLNQNPRAQNARASPPAFDFLNQDDQEEMPLQKLIRHWINERHAPDILPIQGELLGDLLDHIRKQVRDESKFSVMGGLPFDLQVNSLQPCTFFEQIHLLLKMNTSESCLLRRRLKGSNLWSDLMSERGFSR